MAGIQILEPSSAALQGMNQPEVGLEGKQLGLRPGVPIWSACVPNGSFSHCTLYLPPSYIWGFLIFENSVYALYLKYTSISIHHNASIQSPMCSVASVLVAAAVDSGWDDSIFVPRGIAKGVPQGIECWRGPREGFSSFLQILQVELGSSPSANLKAERGLLLSSGSRSAVLNGLSVQSLTATVIWEAAWDKELGTGLDLQSWLGLRLCDVERSHLFSRAPDP